MTYSSRCLAVLPLHAAEGAVAAEQRGTARHEKDRPTTTTAPAALPLLLLPLLLASLLLPQQGSARRSASCIFPRHVLGHPDSLLNLIVSQATRHEDRDSDGTCSTHGDAERKEGLIRPHAPSLACWFLGSASLSLLSTAAASPNLPSA